MEALNLGGLERFTLQLAQEQKRAGHEVSIYCLQEAGVLAPQATEAGLAVVDFGKQPGFSVATLWRVAQALRHDRPDVLHMHNPGVHHYGAIGARLAGVPVVINTRHGVSLSSGRPLQERYFKATLPLIGAVVFVSEDTRRSFVGRNIVPASKAQVILNGLQLDGFAAHQAAPGAPGRPLRFGALSRMVPVKGHSILLDAFATVHRRKPASELRIAGGGPLFEVLRHQVHALGLDGAVRLEGVVKDVPRWLAELDIFVLPSLSEGLPMVILEAMAAGLPIVSSSVGGVPEVAPEGHVAWFGPPGDTAVLAQLMEQAAGAPDLRQRGAEARRLAWESYHIGATGRAYEDLYRNLMPDRRRPV